MKQAITVTCDKEMIKGTYDDMENEIANKNFIIC